MLFFAIMSAGIESQLLYSSSVFQMKTKTLTTKANLRSSSFAYNNKKETDIGLLNMPECSGNYKIRFLINVAFNNLIRMIFLE